VRVYNEIRHEVICFTLTVPVGHIEPRLEITGLVQNPSGSHRSQGRATYRAAHSGRTPKPMNRPAFELPPHEPRVTPMRSTSVIAVGSALPASVPALILTGSVAVSVGVATLVVICIGIAALVI
jgi:hypothetical protein